MISATQVKPLNPQYDSSTPQSLSPDLPDTVIKNIIFYTEITQRQQNCLQNIWRGAFRNIRSS
jgi:hypothetical protein